jgi:parallel beta-helix repeat protein
MSYDEIGLTNQLNSTDSLANQIGSGNISDSIQTDSLGYYQLNTDSRTYGAIVSVGGGGGTFKDIQLAINHVHQGGGGNILIKAGKYVLPADITMYSNIQLVGEGGVSTEVSCGAYSIVFNGVSYAGISLVKMSGFSGTGASIKFIDTVRCRVTDMVFDDNKGDVRITGSPNMCTVDRIISTNCTSTSIYFEPNGLGVGVGDYCVFSNLDIDGTPSCGIEQYRGMLTSYQNCNVANCTEAGIYIEEGKDVTISSGNFSNNTIDGISLTDAINIQIIGCKIKANGQHGVNPDGACINVSITGCSFDSDSTKNINFSNCKTIRCSSNTGSGTNLPVSFRAIMSSDQSVVGNGTTNTTLTVGSKTYDYGANYSTSTYKYTCPVPGIYGVEFRSMVSMTGSAGYNYMRIYKNNDYVTERIDPTGLFMNYVAQTNLSCASGDTLYLTLNPPNNSTALVQGGAYTEFSVSLLNQL